MDELLDAKVTFDSDQDSFNADSTDHYKVDDRRLAIAPCDEVARLINEEDWRAAVKLALEALRGGYIDDGALNCLLGDAYVLGGDFDNAVESYRAALDQNPTMAQAMVSLGVSLVLTARVDAGETQLMRAVDEHSQDLWVLKTAVRVLEANGSSARASICYENAVESGIADADMLFGFGILLLKRGSYDAALAHIDVALNSHPKRTDFLSGKGVALRLLGRNIEALSALNAALAYDCEYVPAILNRGNVFVAMEQWELAIKDFQLCVKLDETCADAHTNLANIFKRFRLYDDAAFFYLRAMKLEPSNASTLNNIGQLKRAEGEIASAVEWFDRALKLEPTNAQFAINKSICLLQSGDFRSGWALFESRLLLDSEYQKRLSVCESPAPLWTTSLREEYQQVLILFEQGFGDCMQFCRYIPKVCDFARDVIVEVPEPLAPLLRSLDTPFQIVAPGQRLEKFQSHRHIMSLPGALGSTASNIPHAGGYLSAESSKVTAWRRVVSERSANVGLAWFGSERHINDHNRSMDLSQILPITRLGLDIDWHSLHVDDRATDVQALREASWIRRHSEALTDFSQTAALVECLDLIITVDTAVAHLAGALGKPVWILLPFVPDYRWLMNRNDSPWYDSARLFRQPSPGDWNSVLREVSSALEESFPKGLK